MKQNLTAEDWADMPTHWPSDFEARQLSAWHLRRLERLWVRLTGHAGLYADELRRRGFRGYWRERVS